MLDLRKAAISKKVKADKINVNCYLALKLDQFFNCYLQIYWNNR